MTWTGQNFSVGQVLTAAQMNNLQADIPAAFNKDSGAPVLANNYIVNAMMADDSIIFNDQMAADGGTSNFPVSASGTALMPEGMNNVYVATDGTANYAILEIKISATWHGVATSFNSNLVIQVISDGTNVRVRSTGKAETVYYTKLY